ncbi:MAG: bifunctional oligoribonuclease/PAP phosphatase NrnA [Thermomicrobiales bacterium]|nr:bifunctional oligoribonuclease/PAP phosphatase NrnA [Thermomicrobiales bacterium]
MERKDWHIDDDNARACLDRLRESSMICIPTHQNIDADGFGTALALYHALRQFKVNCFVLVSDGKLPDSLRFLPGSSQAVIYGQDELPEYDLLCMVDCSDRRRLGDFYSDDPSRVDNITTPIINIDHHITNDHFGVINIVEPRAAATAEIMTVLLDHWGVEKSVTIAQCLLAGIYGDTLGLRTESTTSRTMRMAADLVDAGANPTSITDALFRLKPASTVCLWRHALGNVEWTGALIWTTISRSMLEECGSDPSEAEGIVNFLAGTHGSRAAAILHENEHGWRVSMRSMTSDVDVAAIAAEFGGGGHPRAAGCQVTDGEQGRNLFLTTVAERIARQQAV